MQSTSLFIGAVTDLPLKLRYRVLLAFLIRSRISWVIRIDIFSTDGDRKAIMETIKKVGLYFRELPKSHNADVVASFAISKSSKAIQLYGEAAEKEKPDYMEMLRLSGIPETAVKASTNIDSQLPEDEYPDDLRIIRHHPLVFTLSKEGKDEEVELIRSRLRDIRVYASVLYKQAKEEFKPNINFM
jgi:hypothetical protein